MTELQITAEPGVPQVFTTRTFAAPRDLVFRAFTEPDLLVQWLGPRKYTMTIDRYDLRDGGTYRYIHADDAGNAFAFHGVFHGEPSPDGMVQTFEFEGAPGNVSLGHARRSRSTTGRPPCAPTPCSNPSKRATPWSKAAWPRA